MATQVHPTAIVEAGAKLGQDVVIGAYAYVGGDVTLGDGCVLHHHATVEGYSQLGPQCEVFPYAFIGGRTQDLKAKPGKPGLKVGARNTFREYVSVHLGTQEGEWTILGDDNVLLAYSHIAHDCVIGNHLVISSHSAIAGHVHVGDHVNIGWNAGIHQFCRIGRHCIIGGYSVITQDVLPFSTTVSPRDVKVFAANATGMERRGFATENIEALHKAFRLMTRSKLNTTQAIERIRAEIPPTPELDELLEFIRTSERGFIK